MHKLVLIIILICSHSFYGSAQNSGKYKKRIYISASMGYSPIRIGSKDEESYDPNEFGSVGGKNVYYDPKDKKLTHKRKRLRTPIEIGLNFAISKKNVVKLQYGAYRTYSKMYETVNSLQLKFFSSKPAIFQPFLVRELTIGFQTTNPFYFLRNSLEVGKNKNYIAPINRTYFEFGYVHSFYAQITEYIHTNKDVQFGSFVLGFYRNFYFPKSSSFFLFTGIRSGFTVYQNKEHIDNILQNPEGTIKKETSWNELGRTHALGKAFQLKVGIKYLF